MESDAAFATNVNQGDFTPKNEFRVYSGATDFMGLGGGRDAYQNLKNVLPANPPILTNSIELGVDSNFALYDIQTARNATGGKAARMWPQTENGLKLALEKFPPLRIEWELSTLGGRSDDQVCHHQIPSLYFSSSNRHPPPKPETRNPKLFPLFISPLLIATPLLRHAFSPLALHPHPLSLPSPAPLSSSPTVGADHQMLHSTRSLAKKQKNPFHVKPHTLDRRLFCS